MPDSWPRVDTSTSGRDPLARCHGCWPRAQRGAWGVGVGWHRGRSSTLASLRPDSQASWPGSDTGLGASLAHPPEEDTGTTGQREHLPGPKRRIRSPCPSLFPWAPLVCPGHRGGGLEGRGGVMARGLRKKWGPGGAWRPVPSPLTLKCPRLTL